MNTGIFTETQAQMDESQKKLAALWSETQNQLVESQKKLIESWTDGFSSTANPMDAARNLEKVVLLQQETIDSALNAQKMAFNLAIETQRQLWKNYFQLSQRMTQVMPNR
jgi:hypothetical protein